MIEQLASVSLSCSVVILLLLFLRPLLCRRYRAELRYWIWLALAVRLLVPLSPSWPASPSRSRPCLKRLFPSPSHFRAGKRRSRRAERF